MELTREEAMQILLTALMQQPQAEQKPEPVKPVQTYPIMIGIPEAAERTGLTYNAIRKMCINNQIVHVRAGKRWLVNWEKMVEYLNGDANA